MKFNIKIGTCQKFKETFLLKTIFLLRCTSAVEIYTQKISIYACGPLSRRQLNKMENLATKKKKPLLVQ